MPQKSGDRRGEFDTLSKLLVPNNFQLREFSEPDVFPVFSDPKWTSLPDAFVQPLLKPVQAFCIYSFHWQQAFQAHHHHMNNYFWFCFAPSFIFRLLPLVLEETVAPSSPSLCHHASVHPDYFPLLLFVYFQRDDLGLLIHSAKTMGAFPRFYPP